MEKYTFEQLWKELDNGYQIYYTYMNKKYVLTKVTKNCYSKKLISLVEKNPHPKVTMITLKSVKELFPYMENIEYKV